ncbi:hypothetical protein [Micropruina sp.]|uniref:hypothetical protein n=1 Tax=Micropruina sp. TaxID=2737536 RepID=UPI0039E34049
MRDHVLANLDKAPDLGDIPPDMLAGALTIGTVMGLALGLILSLVALGLIRRLASRLPTRHPDSAVVFPSWLSGVALAGLTVPDLITAATGVIQPWTTPLFLVAYPALVILAMLSSPRPVRARYRIADFALAAFLPFV